jgi:hypothetical protein
VHWLGALSLPIMFSHEHTAASSFQAAGFASPFILLTRVPYVPLNARE